MSRTPEDKRYSICNNTRKNGGKDGGASNHWRNPNDELMIVNELVGTTWMSERRKESQNYGGKVNQTYSSKSDLASFYS